MQLLEISRRLKSRYPDAKYALDWKTPVELLVATILAAQCTDERVNKLTESLFVKYPSARAFADADLEELTLDVKPTGLAPFKAKSIKGACTILLEQFGGEVPRTIDEMMMLPGVGRKTANVVLVTGYRIRSGIIVDTHVKRLAGRLGLSEKDDPDDIEIDLKAVVPDVDWLWWSPAMILHGRDTCTAKKPKCDGCMLEDICPKRGV